MLDAVPIQQQNYISNLFRATTEAIDDGIVASTKRERLRFYGAWTRWMSINFPSIHPDLQHIQRKLQIDLLGAFAHHVRHGGVSTRKHKVRAQTVAVALRAISTTLQLDGKPNPLADSQGKHPKAISQLLEGYRRADPPSQPKLAVPLVVPRHLVLKGSIGTEKQKAVGDLALIAFYYLLRVGEYTYHKKSEKRRTKQFRVSDVALWAGNTRLNPALPLQYLYTHCTAATLSISNQKNGKRSQVIHQEATCDKDCPIKAVIRRIKHIYAHTADQNTMLGTYFAAPHPLGRALTAADINTAVKSSVSELGLERNGLHRNHVGSHSLRAGGAMAMHLHGIPHNTIKKMGRWSSDTFLMYIHEQISAFSENVSKLMSKPIDFHNIAFQTAQAPTLHSPAA